MVVEGGEPGAPHNLLVHRCLLARFPLRAGLSSIGVQENIGTDLAFVEDCGRGPGEKIAPWFEEFFFIAGFVMLLSTNIGIMDYVGRITGGLTQGDRP